MNFASWSGVDPTGSMPCSSIFAFTSGENTARLISALKRATISDGVLAGNNTPYQTTRSTVGNPSSVN